MDDADMAIIVNAAAAMTTAFGTFANSPTFTWDVAEVYAPQPVTWTGSLGGAILLAAVRRRRAVK